MMEKQGEKQSFVDNPKLYNLYSYHRPHITRWKGSVIPKTLPSTFIVTLVSVIVCTIHLETKINLSIQSTFIPVLGFVVGLLLTYRTNTAYDRYWEGRKLWSTMFVAIRNLTRHIWINVKEDVGTSDILEKKTAINLLLGFAIATKHYLREEDRILYDDLKPLISNIKSNLPSFKPLNEKKRSSNQVNHNLPLEIALYLSSYIDNKRKNEKVNVPTTNSMYTSLNTLVDCLTQFERILNPIPLAYSIHLNQTIWIYCLSLPFQLVNGIKYITIPVVFLSSFILIGILHIGEEIENPFGYDENDLDLDEFCRIIKCELETITARQKPSVDDWVYNPENHPFGQKEISAFEASKLSIDEVRTLLNKESGRTSTENHLNIRDIIVEENDEI